MAQDGFERLAQGVETRICRERPPGIFDAPPQDCDPVQLRRIGGQILDAPSLLLPVRETVVAVCTRMDRCMVYDHPRLLRDRVTQGINTRNHHASVSGAFKQTWMHIVLAMHTSEHMDPPRLPGRQLDDALGLLPSIGNRGSKRKARFVAIIQSNLALVFWYLHRVKCTLGLGKGHRVSERLERFAHPLPSKTGLFGQAFQRRQTEALVGGVGEALPYPWERRGLFVDVWQGDGLCRRAEGGRPPAAWFIMPTLGARLCPWLEPGRHGDAMDLRGLGKSRDGRPCGTQEQTMGTAPSAEGGLLAQRLF